jgi:hypothetical protein
MSLEDQELEREAALDLPNREAMSVIGTQAFVPPTLWQGPDPQTVDPGQTVQPAPISPEPPIRPQPPMPETTA